MSGARITWEPRPEFGEDPRISSGLVRKTIRGGDGVTYVVDVGNAFIHVHESRVTSSTE